MKPKSGGDTREEGEVSSRARESVELSVHGRLKMTKETKGALPCEERKLSSEEKQTEGALTCEEETLLSVEV